MSLRERYKTKSTKRLTSFLFFYLFLTSFFAFYNTLAKYSTIVEDVPTVDIAKWNIMVNNEETIEGQTLTNTIKLIPNDSQTTANNKLAPGQEGYFDIIINPEGTEVSIEYTVQVNTTTLHPDINLTQYSILEDNITKNYENKEITGNIELTENSSALTVNEKKTIRIYWEWPETTTRVPTEGENYSISTAIVIKQKIV